MLLTRQSCRLGIYRSSSGLIGLQRTTSVEPVVWHKGRGDIFFASHQLILFREYPLHWWHKYDDWRQEELGLVSIQSEGQLQFHVEHYATGIEEDIQIQWLRLLRSNFLKFVCQDVTSEGKGVATQISAKWVAPYDSLDFTDSLGSTTYYIVIR